MADQDDFPTLLESFYRFEQERADEVYLTQSQGGQYHDLSWSQAGEQARRLATYLQAQGYPEGSRIALYSKNSAYWVIADLAIWMAGHVSVPLYPSLAGNGVRQILQHSQAVAVVIGQLDIADAHAGIPEGVHKIATPLCRDAGDSVRWEAIQANHAPLAQSPRPDRERCATIIYTSGTTGEPKGVMHSFRTASVASWQWAQLSNLKAGDTVFSYLPMSHVGERLAVECGSLHLGLRVFFNESQDSFIADLKHSRPDVFFGVPRIWIKLFQAMRAFMPRPLLELIEQGVSLTPEQQTEARAAVGLDRARFGVSGAAPVPPSLLTWYNRLGLPMIEVFGMSENFGYSHLGVVGVTPPGWIGPACPDVDVLLAGDGEVLIRSPGNMLGYFNDPQRTAEALDADGYLHTGDMGEVDAQGLLRVIGRVRDNFKTSKGKFVAPAPIENALSASPLVEHVCVVGSGCTQPLALVILAPQAAGLDQTIRLAQLDNLLAELNESLEKHERLSALLLLDDLWSVDGGELTPTLKVKRNIIEQRYGVLIETASESGRGVLHARDIPLPTVA